MQSSSTTPRHLLILIGTVALLGAGFACWLRGTYAGQPNVGTGYNIFHVIFARDEVLGLVLVATFSFGAALFLFRPQERLPGEQMPVAPLRHFRLLVTILIVGAFAVAALGAHFVCHDYALSADEFMADFQARIFLHGEITAKVQPQWLGAVRVICPTFVTYLPQSQSWMQTYLPVYAALRALFQSIYLQDLLNPCLAAVTLIALYGVGRRIWPNEQENALVAVLLLAASAQFLVMAMTSYAMPAHLALNTVWLWLYLQPERRRFYLAPVVGVLAIGLHQPIVHALFVAPFLFRLLWERKWKAVTIFGLMYSLGCAGWYAWRVHYSNHAGPPATAFFRLWNPKMLVIQAMDLWLILGWSALATPLLALLGLHRVWRARAVVQDAALSCFVTFGFYYFFYLDQGNGWGYRYVHGTLTCFIIVAVAGWEALIALLSRRLAWNFLLAGTLLSLVVALPLRSHQAESFIRPFAKAAQAIQGMDAGVVGVDPDSAWYSADLIRNDPYLEIRPVVFALIRLRPEEVKTLSQHGPSRFMKKEQLRAFGLATEAPAPRWRDPFRLGRGE
ncbi:MAG: hypothetical protein ACR2MW_05435 [Chthoniobacterales bacterium]